MGVAIGVFGDGYTVEMLSVSVILMSLFFVLCVVRVCFSLGLSFCRTALVCAITTQSTERITIALFLIEC